MLYEDDDELPCKKIHGKARMEATEMRFAQETSDYFQPSDFKELTEESVLLLLSWSNWESSRKVERTYVALKFKEDKLTDVDNYRPVGLKLIWSKVIAWLTGGRITN